MGFAAAWLQPCYSHTYGSHADKQACTQLPLARPHASCYIRRHQPKDACCHAAVLPRRLAALTCLRLAALLQAAMNSCMAATPAPTLTPPGSLQLTHHLCPHPLQAASSSLHRRTSHNHLPRTRSTDSTGSARSAHNSAQLPAVASPVGLRSTRTLSEELQLDQQQGQQGQGKPSVQIPNSEWLSFRDAVAIWCWCCDVAMVLLCCWPPALPCSSCAVLTIPAHDMLTCWHDGILPACS